MWSRSLWETEGLKEVKRNMADYSDSITPYYTVWFLQVRCGNPHLVSSIWWDAIDVFFCSLKWHGWVEKRQRQANNNPKRSWKWTSCLSTLAGLSVVDMVYIFTYFVSKEDPNRGHIIHWTYVLNDLMRVFHLISYCPCSISEVCRRIQSCIVSVFIVFMKTVPRSIQGPKKHDVSPPVANVILSRFGLTHITMKVQSTVVVDGPIPWWTKKL